MSPIYQFDVDGVLMDVEAGLNKFLRENFEIIMTADKWIEPRIDKNENFTPEIVKAFQGLFSEGEFFSSLEPFPGAVEGVKRIYEFGGKIIISTSRHAGHKETTIRHLANLGFIFEEVFCGECKLAIADKISPQAIIEDLPREVEKLKKHRNRHPNFKIILNNLPWNATFLEKEPIVRAFGWQNNSGCKTILDCLIQA